MTVTKGRTAWLVGIVFALSALLGAQPQPELSGFVDTYPDMTPAPTAMGGLMWEKPGLEQMGYTSIIVDQPEIFVHPESRYTGINADQIKTLADSFQEALVVQLVDAYPIVDQPGPKVVRIRLALTDVYMKRTRAKIFFTPIGMAITGLKAAAGKNISLEQAGIEAEVTDSETGEQLAVFVNQRGQVRDRERDLERIDTSWSDIEDAIRDFAHLARARMDLFAARP